MTIFGLGPIAAVATLVVAVLAWKGARRLLADLKRKG